MILWEGIAVLRNHTILPENEGILLNGPHAGLDAGYVELKKWELLRKAMDKI